MPLATINHKCLPMMKRHMVERLEAILKSFEYDVEFTPEQARPDEALGMLWLLRVLYRERAKMNGIGKYKDRAEFARRVCALLGESTRS